MEFNGVPGKLGHVPWATCDQTKDQSGALPPGNSGREGRMWRARRSGSRIQRCEAVHHRDPALHVKPSEVSWSAHTFVIGDVKSTNNSGENQKTQANKKQSWGGGRKPKIIPQRLLLALLVLSSCCPCHVLFDRLTLR